MINFKNTSLVGALVFGMSLTACSDDDSSCLLYTSDAADD